MVPTSLKAHVVPKALKALSHLSGLFLTLLYLLPPSGYTGLLNVLQIEHIPTSGSLHWLFQLPGTPFPRCTPAYPFTCLWSLLGYCLLFGAFSDNPVCLAFPTVFLLASDTL